MLLYTTKLGIVYNILRGSNVGCLGVRKRDEEMKKRMDKIYNGPHSKAAQFFIEQIEGRLGKRPWTPSEEVSIMRAFAVTMDSFNVLVGKPMLKLKK